MIIPNSVSRQCLYDHFCNLIPIQVMYAWMMITTSIPTYADIMAFSQFMDMHISFSVSDYVVHVCMWFSFHIWVWLHWISQVNDQSLSLGCFLWLIPISSFQYWKDRYSYESGLVRPFLKQINHYINLFQSHFFSNYELTWPSGGYIGKIYGWPWFDYTEFGLLICMHLFFYPYPYAWCQ